MGARLEYGEKVKTSAGILLYRRGEAGLEVLIGHMGGPFWEQKDEGAWSIPKGEMKEGENTLEVAKREFEEELGSPPPEEPYLELGEIRQGSGKRVIVFAAPGDLDTESVLSNTFEMEWPRGSGRIQEFPEIDRAAWLSIPQAYKKLIPAQVQFLERLAQALEDAR
jgi:predicted NUDIX family NTP pyrophosphohydrolase